MSRKSKEDWLEVGLKTIGTAGIDGLTIQNMTDQLGVTKGSFYHHFTNMEHFEEALITFWADQYLSTAGDLPGSASERLDLLDRIMEEAFSRITEPEVAIRAWAHRDNRVGELVAKVDHVRNEFVLNVFRSLATSDKEAELMADLFSAMLVGCITSLPPMPRHRVLELYEEFKRLYGL